MSSVDDLNSHKIVALHEVIPLYLDQLNIYLLKERERINLQSEAGKFSFPCVENLASSASQPCAFLPVVRP